MAGSKPYWFFDICECGDYRHQHASSGVSHAADGLGVCKVCGPGGPSYVPDEIRCIKYKKIGSKKEKRTLQQNKSLHKYWELLAEALNDAGYDMKKTLKQDVEIPWNKERVKEFLWRPIQEAMTDKESTTELDTVEPSAIHTVLSRHLGEKLGIYVPWPSNEERHADQA